MTASAESCLVEKGKHKVTTTWQEWTCPVCGAHQEGRTEVSYYDVEPDSYAWTAVAAGVTQASSTWTGPMSKGTGQEIEFTVTAKWNPCQEHLCVTTVTATAKADVHELSIERPDYLGLDRRDAGLSGRAVTNATARIDPAPASATYNWTKCGKCQFDGETDEQKVTYGIANSATASTKFLAENLKVTATAKNAEGRSVSATCITNFTVVAVDVTIGSVGEDKEEKEGAFVQHVPDTTGVISVEGTNKMVEVKFTCNPTNLPANEMVTVLHTGQGELYEVLQSGELLKVTSATYPAGEIANRKLKLYGHEASSVVRDGKIDVIHKTSGASDSSKYTNVKLAALLYKLNGQWRNVPVGGFTNLNLASAIQFKALPTPTSAKWPTGFPRWSGVAQMVGEEVSVVFNASGMQFVTASCGNDKSVRMFVASANINLPINWSHGYLCDMTTNDATTIERPFVLTYTACADVDRNLWHLRVCTVSGGTDISVHLGGYANPIPGVNILTEQQGRDAINDMLLESSANGPARRWVTEDAIRTHEEWHRDEWTEICEHYWPVMENALEDITVAYHLYENDVDGAVRAMRTGQNGVDSKNAKYQRTCRQYWFMLGDSPGDRPYRAGGAMLNPPINAIRNYGARQIPAWSNLPVGVNATPDTNHCYQPWINFNP